MNFTISVAHNEARLEGTKAFLDTGSGHATLHLFSTERPANGGAAGDNAMVIATLGKPCGTVVDGELIFAAADEPLVLTTGAPLWGRLFNGNGDQAGDGDVSDLAGNGAFKVSDATLYAGGTVRVVLGKLR